MERVLEPEVMDDAGEADAYDHMDHEAPNRAFLRRLLALGACGSVLDVGTGPGHLPPSLCAARAEVRVLGIDLSAHMLSHAEQHRAASPHAERMAYRLADAKALPFSDGSFDTVYSNTILHHIPEPAQMIREAFRVLAPGGVLLIRDLFRPESAARAQALVERHAGDCDARQQELFRASLHAALTPQELRALAQEAGIEGAHIVVDSDRHMSLQIPRRIP